VVRKKSLRWDDHTSRGVLQNVVFPVTVIAKPVGEVKTTNRIEVPKEKLVIIIIIIIIIIIDQ
jgi:hypothetical protein